MGRGRQKAKQTKVARELKYFSPPANYRALEQELASGGRSAVDTRDDDEPSEASNYAAWDDDEDD